MFRITPQRDCRYCHGTGTVTDWVDYGSTAVPMETTCDCVLDQLPSEAFRDPDFCEIEETFEWEIVPAGEPALEAA